MKVLTKSRFKLGLECPNKLFYTRKAEYADQNKEDPFLMALADGGFQVEELARMHFPDGVLIDDDFKDYLQLAKKTAALLQQENIVIFEAAFLVDDLFIRTDILVKKGNRIELIEVKSKTFDPSDVYAFIGKKGGIVSGWKPYLFDIAFQKHVIALCHPEWKIKSFLMLADKTKKATIDGLNQKFRITKTVNNRTGIKKLEDDISNLGDSVLGQVEVTNVVQEILSGKHKYLNDLGFNESLELLKSTYINDVYPNWGLSYRACKSCEFTTTNEDECQGLLSGFNECFTKQLNWSPTDFQKPNTFNIWDFRRGDALMKEGKIFKEHLTLDDIGFKEEANQISRTERQWIQIQKEQNADTESYIDIDNLNLEMSKWVFPLHFIDFETCTAALPFNKGRKPYEQIAFQFSHHIYNKNGQIEHQTQYIDTIAGKFPNFDFVRVLKLAIEGDEGSIFRYATHENTILNAIHEQLADSNESDKEDLMEFIKTISHSKRDAATTWIGNRDMIDLCDVVKKYYYNYYTYGSNSLKAVLPAILKTSDYLKGKYSKSIGSIQVSSLNFPSDHIWLKMKEGEILNPYKMLPPIFDGWTEQEIEQSLSEMEHLSDGGAAMTAYGKLQYVDMSNEERATIEQALLKYCELDTLAMVMLYEHLRFDLLKNSTNYEI